ncbi:MAG: redox-sensing transcriptional repressor Rex [Bacilli bacterium]|jgi:redox-sensing transcriptional repressor
MSLKILTKNQLHRMPDYLNLIKLLKGKGYKYINCQTIADDLNLNREQVKKDIAQVATTSGIPNKGRDINQLIMDIEKVLGYDDIHNAIIIGVGNLGKALLKYQGFQEYGLKIVGAFDKDPNVVGQRINNIRVYDVSTLKDVFKDYNAKIGIICVPKEEAQKIADVLVDSGVLAIWNFSPVSINVTNDSVIVSNTNMAASLAVLSHQLYLNKKKTEEKLENFIVK